MPQQVEEGGQDVALTRAEQVAAGGIPAAGWKAQGLLQLPVHTPAAVQNTLSS